jgi:TM2 domain-containing membrane protein YozV
MNFKLILAFLLSVFIQLHLKAENKIYLINESGFVTDSTSISNEQLELLIQGSEESSQRPNPILFNFKRKQRMNKKLVASVLAFPFPFGIVGLHRIYLGTAPHVPVVYIGTFGGVLGILPFIDFCILVLDKDFDRYLNNNKIFMWVK